MPAENRNITVCSRRLRRSGLLFSDFLFLFAFHCRVSYIFGIITFVTGIIGVWTGAEIARRWRKTNMKSDALVCGIGIFASVPFLFLALYVMDKMIYVSWVCK